MRLIGIMVNPLSGDGRGSNIWRAGMAPFMSRSRGLSKYTQLPRLTMCSRYCRDSKQRAISLHAYSRSSR